MDEHLTVNDYINIIKTHMNQIETCLRRIEDIWRAEVANQSVSDIGKLQNLIQPDDAYVEWIYSGSVSAMPSDIAKAWSAWKKEISGNAQKTPAIADVDLICLEDRIAKYETNMANAAKKTEIAFNRLREARKRPTMIAHIRLFIARIWSRNNAK